MTEPSCQKINYIYLNDKWIEYQLYTLTTELWETHGEQSHILGFYICVSYMSISTWERFSVIHIYVYIFHFSFLYLFREWQ